MFEACFSFSGTLIFTVVVVDADADADAVEFVGVLELVTSGVEVG